MTKRSDYIDWATAQYPNLDRQHIEYLYDDLTCRKVIDRNVWESAVQRLESGEPLQYISSIAHFYGYVFQVNQNVLIPRPETEELVYNVIKYIKKYNPNATILDIGTGSGCIPITIKKECPIVDVTAIDVSDRALDIACQNATNLDVKVYFERLDFTKVKNWERLGTYDVIVSNPPYIPCEEKKMMKPNVLDFEPHLALFVEDDDPLLFYRLTAQFAQTHLSPKGMVALELNEYNAEEVKAFFDEYDSVEILHDMQGKERMLIARLVN